MIDLLQDAAVLWALLVALVLPLSIVAAGELDERLRQRQSPLRPAVEVLRNFTLPLLAVWVLARSLFEVSDDSFVLRLVATGLLLSLAAIALVVARVFVAWLRRRPDESGGRPVPQLVLLLPRLTIILVTGGLLLAAVWDVNLSAAFAALGVTSLVVSFALQDTLAGLASGMLLLSDQPFKPGDWIQSGEIEGRVVDVNWRSSRIRTRNGDLLIVPNSQLANSTITNYDAPDNVHRVVVPIQVAYANAPTRAKNMLIDAGRHTPGVLEDPPPAARVVTIDDPLMTYEVDLWIDDFTIAPRVISDFGSLVWYHSQRHDVPLPSPAYDIYLWDGPDTAAASRPDRAALRRMLGRSPLLAQLDEDEMDRMAAAATSAEFAVGEVMIADLGRQELHVLAGGHGRLVVDGADGETRTVADLREGDVFGLVGRSDDWARAPRVVADTDCTAVVVETETADLILGQRPTLADALNQLVASRRRRIDRLLAMESHALDERAAEPPPVDDAAAETGVEE